MFVLVSSIHIWDRHWIIKIIMLTVKFTRVHHHHEHWIKMKPKIKRQIHRKQKKKIYCTDSVLILIKKKSCTILLEYIYETNGSFHLFIFVRSLLLLLLLSYRHSHHHHCNQHWLTISWNENENNIYIHLKIDICYEFVCLDDCAPSP